MTRLAYDKAIEEGVDGFECDVRLSKDGVIVCIHDATTERIAKRKLRVSFHNFKHLQSTYDLISLDELLELAISARKDLLIETKHPNLFRGRVEHKVLELLESYKNQIVDAGIEVIVMSFSSLAIGRVKNKWCFCKVTKYYLPARFSKRTILALNIDIAIKHPSLVARLQSQGTRILIWTVNRKVDFELCRSLRVDGVITNYPKIARKYG